MPSSRTSSGSDNESSPENDNSMYGADDMADSQFEQFGHSEVVTKRIGLSRAAEPVASTSVRYLANSTGFVESPHAAPYYPLKAPGPMMHPSAHNTLNPAAAHHQYYMENSANQYVYRTYSYMPSYYNKQLRNYQQQQQMQLQLNHAARQTPVPAAKYSFQEPQLVNQRMPEVVSVRYLAPMKQISSMMARGEASRQKPAVASTQAIQYQPGGNGERVFAVDNFAFNYPYAASSSRYNLYDGSGVPEQRALDFDLSRSQPHLHQAIIAAQQQRMNFNKLNDGKRKDGKLEFEEPMMASWNRQMTGGAGNPGDRGDERKLNLPYYQQSQFTRQQRKNLLGSNTYQSKGNNRALKIAGVVTISSIILAIVIAAIVLGAVVPSMSKTAQGTARNTKASGLLANATNITVEANSTVIAPVVTKLPVVIGNATTVASNASVVGQKNVPRLLSVANETKVDVPPVSPTTVRPSTTVVVSTTTAAAEKIKEATKAPEVKSAPVVQEVTTTTGKPAVIVVTSSTILPVIVTTTPVPVKVTTTESTTVPVTTTTKPAPTTTTTTKIVISTTKPAETSTTVKTTEKVVEPAPSTVPSPVAVPPSTTKSIKSS